MTLPGESRARIAAVDSESVEAVNPTEPCPLAGANVDDAIGLECDDVAGITDVITRVAFTPLFGTGPSLAATHFAPSELPLKGRVGTPRTICSDTTFSDTPRRQCSNE